MTNLRIAFEHPWLLLLLIPAAALTIILYLRLNKKYRRNRNRITSIILHCLVMLFTISVLSGVYFKYEKPNKENEILLVVDMSESNEGEVKAKDKFIESVIDECSARFQIGIVTFGYNQIYAAPLTYESSSVMSQYENAELPDCTATDIASALLFAKDQFTNPKAAKIVLISDGIQTDDNALSVIKTLTAEGIKVDTVCFENEEVENELQIVSVERPEYTIKVGDKFSMKMSIQSSYEGSATITLSDNDATDEAIDVKVMPGLQTIEIPHTFLVPGMHELEFYISSDADVEKKNNRYITYINLATYDKILIVEREPGEADKIAGLIESENVKRVVVSNLDEMPDTIDKLRAYDQVILMNIANADMPKGFDEILHSFVYDYGGGLLTVGGNKVDANGESVANAYNRLDMLGTLYQQMLPVQAINYTPPLAVVIIIDRSGSMEAMDNTTGRTKLELAKDGAMSCLNALTERDYCGIMTLGTDFNEEIGVTPVTQGSKITAAIDKIQVGGDTVFTGAIERAGQTLAAITNVEKKHIILVTDGMPADPIEKYGEKIENNSENGITMSIVSIQVSAAAKLEMQRAAEDFGKGRFYDVWEASSLPRIMREDLNVPEIEEVTYSPFQPQIGAHNSVVNGVLQADIPLLQGYYGTKLKDGAVAALKGEYVPIYAQWQYGEGNVGSFMCDLNGTWSAEWLADKTGVRILNNIIGGLYPMDCIQPQQIDVEITEDNYTTKLGVFTDVAETETIEVTVSGPPAADSTEPLEIKIVADWTNYSRLEFDITQPGLYEISVQKKDASGVVIASFSTYRTFSYSKEYDMFVDPEVGDSLLDEIAIRGNGVVVSDVYDIFDDFVRAYSMEYDPKIPLIIASIVLFLLDIAVRKFKFKWPHEIIRDRKAQKELSKQK